MSHLSNVMITSNFHEYHLKLAKLPVSLPEMHGLLCGLICSGQRLNGSFCLHHLLMRFQSNAHQKIVLDLYNVVCQQFMDQGDVFQLPLPEDFTDIFQLKSALHVWCLNFLKGLSLSAETYSLPPGMSTAVLDSLRSIIRIAQRKLDQWQAEGESNTLESAKRAISDAIPVIYQAFSQVNQGVVTGMHTVH